jgi:UDP-N-acetylmuramyl pentapeptide phosphotransferase/UDP-N-acetylglucosamine-1-phosphate transferase
MSTHNNLVSAKANPSEARVKGRSPGRSQNQVVVRAWILTMLLVLAGLSTLKLR